jgi:excinuclease UvrABC helicase subunit UvrB
MKHYLIPESGQFYKANMHTHTTVSDGNLTPEAVKEHYMAKGYAVIAYTDHDVMVDHSDLNEEGKFLAITSHEVETSGPAPYGFGLAAPTYHLNFYAKNREAMIEKLTREMKQAAKELEFEKAAYLRDEIARLRSGK